MAEACVGVWARAGEGVPWRSRKSGKFGKRSSVIAVSSSRMLARKELSLAERFVLFGVGGW